MLGRHMLGLTLLGLAACAKATPEVSEQRLQPTAPAASPIAVSADPHAGLQSLGVDAVASMIEAKKLVAVDANGTDTRKEYGTLPGALLLSNSRTYQLGELPADKSTELVFYCGNEQCTSAPKAAKRAQEAGYTAVKVMPQGIVGWVKAGKPVAKLDV